MRCTPLVPFLLPGLLFCLSPAGAEPEARPAPEPAAALRRMTLDLQRVPLRRALELLCDGAGLQYSVSPDVPDVLVNLSVREVPVPAAVRELVAAAARRAPGLMLDTSGESWVIRMRPVPARKAPFRGASAAVSLDVRGVPLRQAVDRLFKGMDVWCAVDPNVPDAPVTVHFRQMTLFSAAWLVAGAASERGPRLAVRRDAGNFVLSLAGGPAAAAPGRADLRLKYVPLRRALKDASAGTGLRYVVEANVPDVPVTLRLRNLAGDAAFRHVTAVAALKAPRVTYARAGDVVVVYRDRSSRVSAWRDQTSLRE